ncbi:carboxymuconolactone decarboxylase family protein [Cryptosporangium phraense]|uniref:Carboxymuconolactone decarboxylase family protein n=1 Tax=Cryptosporangium phraense TaxID=2593070 RepID=A0A545ATZ7_9ACTN|nr:carboxymuconolactone decarboxylase family protein [Cryptosporangium phraense]TQS44075.1 carboxymuconolactone decarboxylase family protein [Cryptosporangium phraense]
MSGRIPRRAPEELAGEERRLYDEIVGGPRAQGPALFRLTDDDGGLLGPFNAMLLSPSIGEKLQALGAGIRYGGELSDRAREIAILAVAAHWDSRFERYAHEAVASHAGLPHEVVTAIRDHTPAALDDPVEQAVLDLSTTLLTTKDLDDDAYARAKRVLGEPAVFELTTLVGYYSTLALQLRVFRADDVP